MHRPKVQTLAFLAIAVWVSMLLSGCVQESTAPAVPTGATVTDIPADDGTNILIAWRHYKSSTAKQYSVYYSLSKDSLENEDLMKSLTPIVRTIQTAASSVGDTTANNVCDLDYYVVLDDPSSENPRVTLVKATNENRDSLASIGEKVLQVESELAPVGQDELKLIYAQGDFYRVKPPDAPGEANKTTVENSTLAIDSTGPKIAEGTNSLIFELGLSPAEKAFRDAEDRIVPFDPEQNEFFLKYGTKILGIVTSKSRYTLDFDIVQAFIRGNIAPGQTYFYKIVADNGKKATASSEILEFTPQNEPPIPAMGASARWDAERSEVLFNWQGFIPSLKPFRDVREYTIHKFTKEDSACVAGEIIGTYAPDFTSAIVKGEFSEGDMFYIATTDKSDQRSVSQPFGLTPFKLSPPTLVEPLDVVDFENDDGGALSVRWGVPQIAIDIVAIDPSPKFEDKELGENYYLVPTESGYEIAHLEATEEMPIDPKAAPIVGVKESKLAEKFDVSVSYRMFINDDNDVLYAKFKLDDGKFQNDFANVGSFKFEGLPAGEHTFEAVLLNSAGKELKNPEARVTRTIVIDRPTTYWDDRPTDHLEFWRGNAEIIRKDTVWLAGVPGFDPTNRFTFEQIGMSELIERQIKDAFPDSLRDLGEYYYFVRQVAEDGSFTDSEIFGPITPKSQLYHTKKSMVLVLVILFIALVTIFLKLARTGRRFYLRPIAGIAHLDEALGRATEMGRPILYVLGLSGISDIATLAGLTILGRVAKKSAEFQTRILVPCVDPIVMIVAQETVKTACMDAGRPDTYNEDDVFYAAGSQFSYAAAVAGLMVRHKTAANFYMGMFFAESLILTETGSMTGSIQIAGTDAVTQIPFFITTCDYTLIGEELYAASAYLSQDPLQVGTLKAQDMLKAIYMVVIVIGTVAMTTGFMWFVNLFKIRLEQ